MSSCPGSTEAGCKCWEHDPGLAAYAPDPAAYERMLAKGRKTTLRVVTPEPALSTAKTFDGAIPFEKPCTGSMICDCKRCNADRAARVRKPSGDGPQLWKPRASRRQEHIAA
jgi:hypothetical protein